jgi:membrane fusion protein, multidrug efflux system
MFLSRAFLAASVLALSTFVTSCDKGPRKEAGKQVEPAPMRVSLATATEGEWGASFEVPGTVRARTTTVISSRVMGYVKEITPREGDRVVAGQTLVKLEAPEMESAQRQAQAAAAEARDGITEAESAVRSADAQLELAQATLKRMDDLLKKKSVSQQEFDEANARTKVAQSGREMAQARRRQLDEKIRQAEQAVATSGIQMSYLEIKAPFAGRISARKAEPGTLASPGLPLMELEREDDFRLEAAVPESQFHGIRAGQSVEVRLEATAQSLSGRVDEIAPSADAASGTLTVKIALPSRLELRGGLFGRAVFGAGRRRVLSVPRAAVIEQGQLRNVLVVDNNVARIRLIRTGQEHEGNLEVLSGLSAGERVVSPRSPAVQDGARLEVTP